MSENYKSINEEIYEMIVAENNNSNVWNINDIEITLIPPPLVWLTFEYKGIKRYITGYTPRDKHSWGNALNSGQLPYDVINRIEMCDFNVSSETERQQKVIEVFGDKDIRQY